MATPAILYSKEGVPLATGESPWGPLLNIAWPDKNYGLWNQGSLTAAGDKIIAIPPGSDSLNIGDIVLATQKKALGVVTLRFFDGTNAANVVVGSVATEPINISMNFMGRVWGWKGAYIQLVTSGSDFYASVLVTYLVVSESQSFDYTTWNSMRG